MGGSPAPGGGRRRRRTPASAATRSPARVSTIASSPRAARLGTDLSVAWGDRAAGGGLPGRAWRRSARRLRRCGSRRPAWHLHHAPAGRVGHAVEIAADAHHALVRDAPFEPQHRPERRQRQRRRCDLSSAKASLTTRRWSHARADWRRVEPMTELVVEVVEVAEAASRGRSPRGYSGTAARPCPWSWPDRAAGARLEAVVAGQIDQGPVVDDEPSASSPITAVFMRS
jgi:hypothetical protein